MSKKNRVQRKDNFNQAMYDMFGIGKESDREEEDDFAEEAEALDAAREPSPVAEPAPRFDAPREGIHRARSTYFAEGTSIEGTLRCKGDVELCGDFKGELIAGGKATIHASTTSNVSAAELVLVGCTLNGDAKVTGSVTIDGSSSINGNVTAANMFCSGVIHGNLHVSENITLTEKAQVYGDISADTLAISRGAKISGKIEMGLNKQQPSSGYNSNSGDNNSSRFDGEAM